MIKMAVIIGMTLLVVACGVNTPEPGIMVTDAVGLTGAIQKAKAGDVIVMANGIWNDVQIKFNANGTEQRPITLRAETPGLVSIEGQSSLNIGGAYLIVDGLYFKNGYTPGNSVIQFKTDEAIANHCSVINTVIDEFTQPNRFDPDHWVEFYGRYNQLDHCYLAGKSNQGPTVRVFLTGNEHIRNYHQITNNYFGPRPRKGGPKAETMQIGDSFTSMTPSYVQVIDNLFERCNGEVEIISSKSNFNEFRNNIFFESEGSLVMRHGNYCIVDGNFFIGDKNSQFNGGIRVINTGHWITNNYFYMLKGNEFRASLAIMNGIPKSPLNRYNQVTDAVVAYNTWIDCESPWQLSVGANSNKSDVLPPSEIRSARPIRTVVANNIIYNHKSDVSPIISYDKVDGISFKNNITNNTGVKDGEFIGLNIKALEMDKVSDWLYIPSLKTQSGLESVYSGFDFENIKTDVFGNLRSSGNRVGAIGGAKNNQSGDIKKSAYGPAWFEAEQPRAAQKVLLATNATGDLAQKIAEANSGDLIELQAGKYTLEFPLVIDKKIILKSQDPKTQAVILYAGIKNTPAFEMNPKGSLSLENISLIGNHETFAFAPLEENMRSGYNLWVEDCQIEGFQKILLAYRGSFADTISFSNTSLKHCFSGIDLAAETDDKGDYNAEFLNLINCEFDNIQTDVLNFYRGGYDESTIGGNLLVQGCHFQNCGKLEKSKILLKTRGIINVEILNNTFINNPVQLVALLWGEKDNRHSGNDISRLGVIRVDQYLKQKLVY